MKLTPKEKNVIDKFNSSLAKVRPHDARPTDEELAKMTDAEILAGDWLVDIEDSIFWDRWDKANSNLTAEIDAKVKAGLASYWRPQNPTLETAKSIGKAIAGTLHKHGAKINIRVGDPKIKVGYLRKN